MAVRNAGGRTRLGDTEIHPWC